MIRIAFSACPARTRRPFSAPGLPMVPVARIESDTVEATVAAWRRLEVKELLPVEVFCAVDDQIEGSAKRTLEVLRG